MNLYIGLDDWVLESDHYKFYTEADDFKVNIENEHVLPFPEYLHVYTFERDNYTRFPSPKKGTTGVLGLYYFNFNNDNKLIFYIS